VCTFCVNEINRLERIVKAFLLFARPSEPALVMVNADQPLREAQALMSPQLEKLNISLTMENSDSGLIKIDSQQIKQVLVNLIQNAADSIGRNGHITLHARRATRRIAGQMAEVDILEVSDTGKGIPPEAQACFDSQPGRQATITGGMPTLNGFNLRPACTILGRECL
jgi:signal transduction histidine kinase